VWYSTVFRLDCCGLCVLIAAGLQGVCWAQQASAPLPSSPVDSVARPVGPLLSAGQRLNVPLSPPTIHYSVPQSTMALWKRLALPLPAEIYAKRDFPAQLLAISEYLGVPFHCDRPLDVWDGPNVTYDEMEFVHSWFAKLRGELKYRGWEITASPQGLVLNFADKTRKYSEDYEEPEPLTVVYDVTDLDVSPQRLVEMIYKLVHTNSWEDHGGEIYADCEAVITGDGRFLVVRHHEDSQGAVLLFLESLARLCVDDRSADRGTLAALGPGGQRVPNSLSPRAKRLIQLMEAPTPNHLRSQRPLDEVIQQIQRHGVYCKSDSIYQDVSKVTIDLRTDLGSFYNDLNHALSEQGIRLLVGQHWLELTNSFEPDSHEVVIYDVTSLQIPQMELGSLIMLSVSPLDWEDNGGNGDLDDVVIGGRHLLGVVQTPAIHWQLRRFLERLTAFVAEAGDGTTGNRLASTPVSATADVSDSSAAVGSIAITMPKTTTKPVRQIGFPDTIEWRDHKVLSDFWPPGASLDNMAEVGFPVFYDVTDLKAGGWALESMAMAMVWPLEWEENGGAAGRGLTIFPIRGRRILIANASLLVQHELEVFLQRVAKTLGRSPIRTNLEKNRLYMEGQWTEEPRAAGFERGSEERVVVRVYDISPFHGDLNQLRERMMTLIAAGSWEDQGGDCKIHIETINQVQLLMVRHHPSVQRQIEQFWRRL